jgi:AcrR family transcriptional regulator
VRNAILSRKNLIPEHGSRAERPRGVEAAVDRALARQRAAYAAEAERLVQAALALIRERGQLEPPVAAIVKRARLSNQAFYRQFRGKHELLVAVLDHGIALLEDHLRARMSEAAGPRERVRAWLRGLLAQALDPRGAEATRPFALARAQLARHYPEEVAASERRLTALVRDAIAEARRAGELPGADPNTDAEALYHLAMGWLEARLAEPQPASRARAKRLESFALAGLRGEALDSGTGATPAVRTRDSLSRRQAAFRDREPGPPERSKARGSPRAASGPAARSAAGRAQRGEADSVPSQATRREREAEPPSGPMHPSSPRAASGPAARSAAGRAQRGEAERSS